MRYSQTRLSFLTAIALFSSSIALPLAASEICGNRGLISDFSDGHAARGFAAEQKQDGSIKLAADPKQASNQVVRLTAGPKGRRVGKGALIHRFAPIGIGNYVEMSARFFVPEGGKTNSVILMDLECASCGLDTNPGLRLYLRDGRIRIDRSKVGVKEPFYPRVDHKVSPERWYLIRWRVDLGDTALGQSEVYLDGKRVLNDRGVTVLTQRIVSQLADIKVKEQVDRFQVGLTANSNKSSTELLVDDVRFCTGPS